MVASPAGSSKERIFHVRVLAPSSAGNGELVAADFAYANVEGARGNAAGPRDIFVDGSVECGTEFAPVFVPVKLPYGHATDDGLGAFSDGLVPFWAGA